MSVLRGEYASESKGSLWPSLNRLMFVLIGVTISSAVAYRELPQFSKRNEQEVQIEDLNLQIERLKQVVARKQREVNLLKNDPEYVGMIARDRLDLMKAGEMVFRLDAPRIDISKMHRRE